MTSEVFSYRYILAELLMPVYKCMSDNYKDVINVFITKKVLYENC